MIRRKRRASSTVWTGGKNGFDKKDLRLKSDPQGGVVSGAESTGPEEVPGNAPASASHGHATPGMSHKLLTEKSSFQGEDEVSGVRGSEEPTACEFRTPLFPSAE